MGDKVQTQPLDADPGSDWLEGIQLAPPSPGFLQCSAFEEMLWADTGVDSTSFPLGPVPDASPPQEQRSVALPLLQAANMRLCPC